MNYLDFSKKERSSKSLLCHIEAKKLAKIFSLESGAIYSKTPEFYVVGVSESGVNLSAASSEVLSASQFYYNPIENKLWVRMSDDSDPKTKTVVITYRLFFADKPYNLPANITSGEDVEYQALIRSIGSLKFDLDFEQTGVALESNSNITLENTSGYFDNIFDTLIFENQKVDFYSWSPSIPLSESRKIYSGFIKDKTYSDRQVRFNLVDVVFQLRKSVELGEFSGLDGVLSSSDLGKPKARVYGKVKTMRTIGVDKTLSGYFIGDISGSNGSPNITGTDFLDVLSPDDEILVTINGETERLVVQSVTSDTAAVLTRSLTSTLVDAPAVVAPAVPYRGKNRFWHIAGHSLHQLDCVVTEVISSNRYNVNTVDGLSPGDILSFGGQSRTILRISGSQIVFTQGFSPEPVVTNTFSRFPVLEVFFGTRRMVVDRDFTLNNSPESVIVFNTLAEFNISPVLRVGFSMTFTNGSRTITTATSVDLKTLFKSRDWIISGDITHQVWYEILAVNEQSLVIRVPYAGPTAGSTPTRKNVEYIDDDSLITVSCYGKGMDGKWIRTPSDAVKDLVVSDAGITGINTDSFDKSSEIAPYTVSMVIRQERKIRDVISDFNKSCFGSLFQKSDFSIAYNILNADKPSTLEEIKDDDIIDFSAKTSNSIVNRVIVNYRDFVDVFSGEDTNEVAVVTSSFVNETSQIEQTREVRAFLYDQDDAETLAQRIAFFNSLSQSVVTVSAKLQFMLSALNDQVFISLDRLFKRYGSGIRKKIGIINSITKTETSTQVEINDLSGVFTRVPSIAPTDSVEFLLASESDVTKFGYIVDDNTLTPDNTSEVDLGNNLIG